MLTSSFICLMVFLLDSLIFSISAYSHIIINGWTKGISIPFWDKKDNFYLANPDGSEDLVEFNRKERSYKIITRIADKGQGRYAYLLNK